MSYKLENSQQIWNEQVQISRSGTW